MVIVLICDRQKKNVLVHVWITENLQSWREIDSKVVFMCIGFDFSVEKLLFLEGVNTK